MALSISKNPALQKATRALRVRNRFSAANGAWTTGDVERMVREVVRATKSILNERRKPPSEWVVLLPAVQSPLNTVHRQRWGMSLFQATLGVREEHIQAKRDFRSRGRGHGHPGVYFGT